jgi:hypothetical protein
MDMTHDDLTPEEREALSRLPRERTPSAGLEDRVVAAMREKGHIARKPARVIRLTTSRVAGLLAACLVLMIGAYSIGLRGRVSHEVLRNIEPQPRSDAGSAVMSTREEETSGGVKPPSTLGHVENQAVAPANEPEAQFVDKTAPAFQPKLNVPQLAPTKDEKKASRKPQDEVAESMQKTFAQGLNQGVPGATDLAAPSAAPMPAQLRAKAMEAAPTSRTFALHGGTLIVDAPDSLRIVTDEQGRTLLIYTSDGVIRIRLSD